MRPGDEASFNWAQRLAHVKAIHPGIYRLATAIKTFEGWQKESSNGPTPAYRNNNPGNLRWSPFMDKKGDGFAYFGHYHQGMYALMWDLMQKALGKTQTGLGPESSLLDLFKVYAPEEDNNNPHDYAEFVAGYLKGPDVSPADIKLGGMLDA